MKEINDMEQNKKELKFCECETIEQFKKKYKEFHLQNLALQDGLSYYDVTCSNVDGTMIGEQFDHPIRMKAFYENNKKFFDEINEEELMKEVNETYQTGINNFINDYGQEELDKSRESYGKYYTPYKVNK